MLRMFQLSSDDGLALLGIARRAIFDAVTENCLADFSPFPPKFSIPRGIFVTLYRNGKLRGCVGQVENPGPLAEGVVRAAINAALHDSRFPPVAIEEVATLDIEVSVLSPLERIAPGAIVAGHHGVLVVRPPDRGILLPRVALEWGWSGQRLVEETCAKAGLGRDAWKGRETQVFAFTAEVFSETGIRPSSSK
jgi:AmmeMemoRadiSam system protein A